MKLQNSHLYTSFLFGLLLPFSTALSNVALIGFYVAVALLVLFKKSTFQKSNIHLWKYSSIALFLICLLSVIVTKDYGFTLNIMGRRVSYLLTPLVFLFLSKESLFEVKKIALKGLFIGSLLAAVFLISKNFIFYFATRPFLGFDNEILNFYHTGFQFTEAVGIHPSYLGMYSVLALAYLVFEKPIKSKIISVLFYFIIAILLLFLASRITLFLFVLLGLFYLWKKTKEFFKDIFRSVLIYVGVLMALLVAFYLLLGNTYLFQRVTKESLWELSYNASSKYNSKTEGDSRVARWVAAKDLLYEKPFFGHGIGTEKEILTKKYIENDLMVAASYRYGAHNQFLSYFIESGFLGVVVFLFFLGSNIVFFLRSKDLVAIFFVISLIAISLIENFFNSNAGITFISFFSTIFLFTNYRAKTKH